MIGQLLGSRGHNVEGRGSSRAKTGLRRPHAHVKSRAIWTYRYRMRSVRRASRRLGICLRSTNVARSGNRSRVGGEHVGNGGGEGPLVCAEEHQTRRWVIRRLCAGFECGALVSGARPRWQFGGRTVRTHRRRERESQTCVFFRRPSSAMCLGRVTLATKLCSMTTAGPRVDRARTGVLRLQDRRIRCGKKYVQIIHRANCSLNPSSSTFLHVHRPCLSKALSSP